MIYMNEEMRAVLSQDSREDTEPRIDAAINSIVSGIKIIHECVVYDKDEEIQEQQIDFDKIIALTGDWTGYEIGINEIIIDLPLRCCPVFGDRFYDVLTEKFRGRKFVIYIYAYEEMMVLRFHTYREEDGLWLDEDLNKYSEPILCIIK